MSNYDGKKNQFVNAMRIIDFFYDRQKANSKDLAKHLGISVRTAQRYIGNLSEAGFILSKDENNNYSLVNSSRNYDNIMLLSKEERALLYTLLQMGKNFFNKKESINNIINTLKLKNALSETFDSKEIRTIDVSLIENIFSNLTFYIQNKSPISFKYRDNDEKVYIVSPHKTLFFNGFWYLIGIVATKDNESGLRVYRLDYIKNILPPSEATEFLEATEKQKYAIENCNTMWIGEEPVEAIFEVYGSACQYFKELNLFKKMEILDEKVVNSINTITVKATVFSYMDLFIVLAPYMPYFKIISPVEYKDKLSNMINTFSENLNETNN